MKKIKYLLFGVLLFVIGANVSNAASLSIATSKRTVTVGSTVNVTVTASGAAGWEYCLSYDSSIFTLVSSTSDTGGSCVRTGSTLIGYSKVNYTLRANKSGTSTIGIRDYGMYNDAGENISASVGSVTLTTKTQAEIEASYSTDANLRNLSIEGYELTPDFDKNTLEYELEVENEVEKIDIKATRSDNSAHVTGIGEKELSEGINKFDIVVTAQKGNKKTYTITVNRKELNPITVKVDRVNYNVVRKAESLEAPIYYTSNTVIIDDTEVPAFTSEITGYTLVGLKDEEGNIALYIYENGTYRIYKQIGNEGFIFIIEDVKEPLEGYENKKNIKINEIDTDVYFASEDDELVLIYGMNASSGKKNWYKYDIKEGTFQRHIEEENKSAFSNEEFSILLIACASGFALSILIIIVLSIMLAKKDKQRKKLIEYIESKLPSNDSKAKAKKETKTEKEEKANSKTKKKKELVEEETDPEIENLNMQFLEFVDKNTIENTQTIPEETVLSKRELRRLEKERKLEEEKELKEMQEDFLSTSENEIVDDSDIIEEVETNKKPKKSKKKKNN